MPSSAKLITNFHNIAYLSGFTGSAGFMLLTSKKQYLFTDFRYIQRAKNKIRNNSTVIDSTKMWKNPEELEKNWTKILKKHHISQIGVEENSLTISRFKKFKKISKGIKFINISGIIEKKREIKSIQEINKIKKSQQINEKILEMIKKFIQKSLKNKTKISEQDLVWKIKEYAHNHDISELAFDPIVAFNSHSSIPHHLPDNTRLKKGDIILIDMGIKYQGYCSDMTRTFFTKPPTSFQEKIYNIVLSAQNNAIKKIKAGISGKTADNFTRKIINNAGYGEFYGHAGGHGLGLEIHEIPSLAEHYTEKIRKNSIITVEPGIYLENQFGVRIEDMILVKQKNCQNLTKFPKSLNKVII